MRPSLLTVSLHGYVREQSIGKHKSEAEGGAHTSHK